MIFKRDQMNGAIYARQMFEETGDILKFSAQDLQPTVNGKTTITIVHESADGQAYNLASHRYNVHDMTMRVRLANGAYKSIHNGLRDTFSDRNLQSWLFDFTSGLHDYDSQTITSELVSGDPSWRPKFLAFPHILEGGMSIMAARGGSTKSYTGIAAAVSVDAGVDKLWPIEVVAPALYINMERSPQSIAGRIGWVNEALELEGDRPLEVFHTKGKTLIQVEQTLRRIVAEKGIQFAVLDSLSRTGLGDLNDNEPSNRIMDMMSALFDSSLILAHSPKDRPGQIFGSDMFRNAGDIAIGLEANRIGDEPITWTSFEIEKANDLGVKRKSWLAFEFEEDDSPDPRIKISRLVDIRIPTALELPDFNEEQHLSKYERIMRYLADNGTSSAPKISENLDMPQGTVRRELNDNKGRYFVKLSNNEWGLLSQRNDE